MVKAGLGLVLGSVLLAGCMKQPAPEIVEVPLSMACKEVPPKVVEVAVPVPMPCQLNDATPVRTTTTGRGKGRVQRVSGPLPAKQRPPDGTISNKVQVHPYMPGALYQVNLGVTNATMLVLQPGETLGAYVAGDKERWDVADIQTGSPEGMRPAVLAKCKWPDTHTNLTITTNKRVYLLELHCTERAYQAMVSWEYPGDSNTMQVVAPVATLPEVPAPGVAASQDPERRNYAYEITLKKGTDTPGWFPQAVYDNGQQTIIEFAQDITHGDAPVLYLRTAEQTQSVVNYRVIGHGMMYQVDRLFDHAELVQGEKKPTIVTILRKGLRKS